MINNWTRILTIVLTFILVLYFLRQRRKRAALVLDIDGTILDAEEGQVSVLIEKAKRLGVSVYVNTARPALYCKRNDLIEAQTGMFVKPENHYCQNPGMSVPDSKVDNMRQIMKRTGIKNRKCLCLLDDLEENTTAVVANGFSAVHTPGAIVRKDIEKYLDPLRRCL